MIFFFYLTKDEEAEETIEKLNGLAETTQQSRSRIQVSKNLCSDQSFIFTGCHSMRNRGTHLPIHVWNELLSIDRFFYFSKSSIHSCYIFFVSTLQIWAGMGTEEFLIFLGIFPRAFLHWSKLESDVFQQATHFVQLWTSCL